MEKLSIYQKVFNAKKTIGKISKDSTNPFFKSKYFDINQLLEHIEPALTEYKLLCIQPVIDGAVVTKIIDIESGEFIESSIKLSGITDPQKLGSEITYHRRYTLQSLLSLQAEDDDANSVSHATTDKPFLNEGEAFNKAIDFVKGKGSEAITDIKKKYKLSKVIEEKLINASKAA